LLEWHGRINFGPSEVSASKDDVFDVVEPIAKDLLEYDVVVRA